MYQFGINGINALKAFNAINAGLSNTLRYKDFT